MPRQRRTAAAAEAALIGKFLLWAGEIAYNDGVFLIGREHNDAIQAAAKYLYRTMQQEKQARQQRRKEAG
jgi:hypothetical protein